EKSLVALRFTDNTGEPTQRYPLNPNGTPQGIAALTTTDGRFTIMMPHPERISRTMQMSWHDKNWGKMSPWFKIFLNARKFVE
ncbi:MAG TPA: phosphoribosylformylglycinamidine synthase subunit PurQ, partial [Burkholderiales bacterium]|nr:phosphoribosylformylglycinamidine synthase subunit PurQ [Burkholderiales bacterium]